jgi:hypothetical protein
MPKMSQVSIWAWKRTHFLYVSWRCTASLCTLQSLPVKQHPDKGVYVDGLKKIIVAGPEDVEKLLDRGHKHRSVGASPPPIMHTGVLSVIRPPVL